MEHLGMHRKHKMKFEVVELEVLVEEAHRHFYIDRSANFVGASNHVKATLCLI